MKDKFEYAREIVDTYVEGQNRKVALRSIANLEAFERTQVSQGDELNDVHLLIVVKQALLRGWKLLGKESNYLILRGDKSENWATIWRPMLWEGKQIAIPNFLERRLQEIEVEKLQQLKENVARREGVDPDQLDIPNQDWIPIIGAEGLCQCNCVSKCPLGKSGTEQRCTKEQLIAGGCSYMDNLKTIGRITGGDLHVGAGPDRLGQSELKPMIDKEVYNQTGAGWAELLDDSVKEKTPLGISERKEIFCMRRLEQRCGYNGYSGCTEADCPCLNSPKLGGVVTHIVKQSKLFFDIPSAEELDQGFEEGQQVFTHHSDDTSACTREAVNIGFNAARNIVKAYVDGEDQIQALRTLSIQREIALKELGITDAQSHAESEDDRNSGEPSERRS
jgi:hypothetical protein